MREYYALCEIMFHSVAEAKLVCNIKMVHARDFEVSVIHVHVYLYGD